MAFSAILALQSVAALVTGALYAYIGRIVLARRLTPEAHRANLAFATWWYAFGALEVLVAAYTLPAAFGYRNLPLVITIVNVLLLLIAVGIAGLVYFLLYLYTGSQRLLWPIVALYSAFGFALLYLIAWMDPIGFDESKGPAQLRYVNELMGVPAILFGLTFSLPVVLAALGYGSLYFRTRGPEQRLRIATISLSFLGWFGWSAVSSALQLAARYPDSVALLVVNTALGLAVPLVILVSYRPPAWLRARLEAAAERQTYA